MNFNLSKRLAGLMLAAAMVGGPLAGPALAQDAPAPVAAPAEAAAPTDAAPVAEAPAPEAAAAVEAPAAEAPTQTVDKGDTAWMLVSAVLVMMMIVPGLALFYGGLVRQKNMLSMLMQVTTVAVIGMVAWVLYGYSLAFSDGGGLDKFVGGAGRLFLKDVTPASNVVTFSTFVGIPELAFIGFQMTFAAITAALVLGGVAERMKFAAVVMFAVLWPLLSYYPMAHMVWWWAGPDTVALAPTDPIQSGFIWGLGALILGLIVSPICVIFCSVVKNALKYDDSLDAFGIHAVGGIVGAIGTGLLVNPDWGGAGVVDYTTCAADGDISTCDSATYVLGVQVMAQVKAVLVTIVWSGIASAITFLLIKFTVGIRVTADTEEEGLDIVEHGERAYHS